MDGLINFRIDVKLDDKTRWISLRGDLPEGSHINYIWFVLTEKQLEEFAMGGIDEFTDGMHRLYTAGDYVVFYDFNIGDFSHRSAKTGNFNTKYFHTNFPVYARKAILRYARKIWNALAKMRAADPNNNWRYSEVSIPISSDTVQRWERLYGQGKGEVIIDMAPECKVLLDSEIAAPNQEEGHSLKETLDYILNIPRNRTFSVFHQTKLKLYTNNGGRPGSYYWQAYDRVGRIVMNGSIDDHGRDGKHHWSSHT